MATRLLPLLLNVLLFSVFSSSTPLPGVRKDATSAGVVRMPMSRRATNKLNRRGGTVSTSIQNEWGEGDLHYFVDVAIGTSPVSVSILVDTGSSDTWVYAASDCPSGDTCYDPSTSSTEITLTDFPEFSDRYGTAANPSEVSGYFVSDVFSIGSATVQPLDFAVVQSGNGPSGGILGLGFDVSEGIAIDDGVKYPTVVDAMYNQGIIGSRTFSLYLDDLAASSGALLFGGYDRAKYTGDIVSFYIQPEPDGARLAVPFSSLTISDASGTTSLASGEIAAVLDSGTPITNLPQNVYDDVVAYLSNYVKINPSTGSVDCALASMSGTLNYGFGVPLALTVKVPFSELAFSSGDGGCKLGVQPAPDGEDLFFGDTFMRSAYIVVDYDNLEISLAQSNFNSAESDIIPL